MNIRMIAYLIGQMLRVESALMLLPLLCNFIYREDNLIAFLVPIVLLAALGTALTFKMPKNRNIYAKEGFVIVGISWILLSLFGAMPFLISGVIPHFCDAFFETVSGFTTTGASILRDVETLPKSMLFWRSFTHWIGGMGVLVFTLAVLPRANERSMRLMHVMRAEVPGPVVGKLVARIKSTARILYGIYITLTALEILLLLPKMSLFDALCTAFGTAGTGGFGIWNDSIAHYGSVYVDAVVSLFLVLFSMNFNLFYLLLLGHVRPVLRNTELRCFLGIVSVATLTIAIDIRHLYPGLLKPFRYAFFQVMTIISTAGFSTANFNDWPVFSRTVLVLLMFIGACAGSTGGGIKVGRIVLLCKSFVREIRHMLHPRSVNVIRIDGKRVEEETIQGALTYMATYLFLFSAAVVALSAFDNFDMITNFTAAAACFNNIGPGLELVGPNGNYWLFADASKYILSFTMLAGRLELFPMLVLFSPSTWKNH
ncbi:MAG: TrkH family potassium uptake protein [Oscillospiraceae bacterium]|nr:TrkH family potassium uptake protein [Oscillospiraceae bacterium]